MVKHFFVVLFLGLSLSYGLPSFAVKDYVIGSGDVVRVTVYLNPDLTTVAHVSENGTISFPLLGEIEIGTMTELEAQTKIATALVQKKIVNAPQVTLMVEEYNSNQVSVLGYVNQPGRYAISQNMNILDVIAEAGGINERGSNYVILRRGDGSDDSYVIDVTELVRANETRTLLNEDVIYVPEQEVFYIYGEVRQPGAYPLKKRMSVMQAISVGGGLTERGTQRGVKINRRNTAGKLETMSAHLSDLLKLNDVVYVKQSIF